MAGSRGGFRHCPLQLRTARCCCTTWRTFASHPLMALVSAAAQQSLMDLASVGSIVSRCYAASCD